jgi:gas vesicle protein
VPIIPKEAQRKFLEAMSFDELERKIMELIDPKDDNGHRTWRYYIKNTYPDHCVVSDTNENKLYRVDYTVDANDDVTLGQWQEAEYVLQIKPGGATIPAPDTVNITEGTEEGDIGSLVRLTEAAKALGGNKFRMTVMKPGWNVRLDGSLGDRYYTRQFIASMLPLTEGCKSYADHQTEREERERPANSVLKLVGHWSDAKQEPDGSCTATFNLSESAAWLRPHLLDAEKLKNEKGIVLVGPSINGYGNVRMGEADGRRGKIAESIKHLQSIDIVTEPGAGGTVDKMLEQAKKKEDDTVDWSKVTMDDLMKNRPDMVDEMKKAMADEAKKTAKEKTKEDAEAIRGEFEAIKESVKAVGAENKQLRAELAAERVKGTVKTKIGELLKESKLPDISRDRLARLLETRDFTKDGAVDEEAIKEAVTAAVEDEKAYLGKLTESGRVVDMGGGGDPPNPVEKIKTVQNKLDKMFGVEEKPAAGQ